MSKQAVIIDTDPGDDDAASILWAIACGKFDIKALTISNGNVGVDWCVVNALRTLEAAKRTDIPVYAGAYRPLVRPAIEAEWIHGKDGLGDAGIPLPKAKPAKGYAPAEMARIVRESPEPVTILSLGPLTNTALAVLLDKEFASRVSRVIFMGGAVRVSGNESPRASFNAAVDPEAAHVVFTSGIPVVQIGLDVCNLVTQTVADLDRIGAAGTAVSDFLIKILDFRRNKAVKRIVDASGKVVGSLKAEDQVASRKGGGIGLNDLTATGYLIEPGWFTTMHAAMDVETSGRYTSGETIVDYMGLWGRKPNGHFAHEVQGRELVERWVKDMTAFDPKS